MSHSGAKHLLRTASILFGGALIACGPITEARYAELSKEIDARNAERRTTAWNALVAKGYRTVEDEEPLYASLNAEDHRRCVESLSEQGAHDAGAPLLETVTVRVHAASQAGRTSPTEEAIGTFNHACRLFAAHTAGTFRRANGESALLYRYPGRRTLTKDPRGELVEIEVHEHVVSTKSVVVKRQCDLMPRGDSEEIDFERGLPIKVTWTAPAQLRKVELAYDVEALEVRCSENVY